MLLVNLEQFFSWIGGGIGAVTGIIALIVSVHFTRRATKAAEDAAESARMTAEVEADRRHGELTPQVTVAAAAVGHGSDRVSLTLGLSGPSGLQHLDEVLVRIRSDQPQRHLAGDPSEEELRSVVWAPYRLVPGVDGADSEGRSVHLSALRCGDRRTLVMEPSVPAGWINSAEWAARYDETPIRLEIECVRSGSGSWHLLQEVPQPQAAFDCHVTPKSHGTFVLTWTNGGDAPAKDMTFSQSNGGELMLEGTHQELVHPGESTPDAWIPRTGNYPEWIELAWTDTRGAKCSTRFRLPA